MLVHVEDWGSYHILGQTLDDAVGEAFDKVAKALGLGYPGGPAISRLASEGNPRAITFPRALIHEKDLRFSLSGLKTAVINYIRSRVQSGEPLNVPDIAASFQQAVIDVQVAKAVNALELTGARTFCLGGGVAANRALREAYKQAMEKVGIEVVFPLAQLCTDNAAMIAAVALDRYRAGRFMELSDDAHAQANLEASY
jgi:N6-L-threonylcarbamoyladenine synthase